MGYRFLRRGNWALTALATYQYFDYTLTPNATGVGVEQTLNRFGLAIELDWLESQPAV